MADRNTAAVGQTLTLQAKLTLNGVETDVYDVSQVELVDEYQVVAQTQTVVTNVSTGVYEVTFDALTSGGEMTDHWYYTPVDGADEQVLVNEVTVAEFEGAQNETAASESGVPDVGLDNVCLVTHTFYDAGGDALGGVYVRFSPEIPPEQSTTLGYIAECVTAETGSDGVLSMYLMRGMTGMLAITGTSLVREVTVPDATSVDLMDLIAASEDLFEVQDTEFFELPRRS